MYLLRAPCVYVVVPEPFAATILAEDAGSSGSFESGVLVGGVRYGKLSFWLTLRYVLNFFPAARCLKLYETLTTASESSVGHGKCWVRPSLFSRP